MTVMSLLEKMAIFGINNGLIDVIYLREFVDQTRQRSHPFQG